GETEGSRAPQVSGWNNPYAPAQTHAVPARDPVAPWLTEHTSKESRAALVHNDYKYDNLLLDPADLTRVIAVLDWEMATVGDPLMDLGTTLGYWVESGDPEPVQAGAFGPTAVPGSLTRQELVARYAEKTGRGGAGMVFYYSVGLYKIAVIVQPIYARVVP